MRQDRHARALPPGLLEVEQVDGPPVSCRFAVASLRFGIITMAPLARRQPGAQDPSDPVREAMAVQVRSPVASPPSPARRVLGARRGGGGGLAGGGLPLA